jgi:hypothetical protein
LFIKAGVRADELTDTKSSQAKAIKIGQFFTPLVGREVVIQVKGRTGKAVLRVEKGRANEKRYYFDISWQAADGATAKARPSSKATNPTHRRSRSARNGDKRRPGKGKGGRAQSAPRKPHRPKERGQRQTKAKGRGNKAASGGNGMGW